MSELKVTLLAGGVGGAKAALGLSLSEFSKGLKVIGNVGDDQVFHGLWVSPDIDTLTYTLAGKVNRGQGWGLEGDQNKVLQGLTELGMDTWMQLGDMDFATHIFRTEQKRLGYKSQQVASQIAKANGVDTPIILPTNDVVQTKLRSGKAWLNFQDYFVRSRCQPAIDEIRYQDSEKAKATEESLAALANCDLIMIAPSNPLLSIGAILSIEEVKAQLMGSSAPVVAVSPIIAGAAIKGPACQLLTSLGYRPDVVGVASYYQDLIDVLVIDQQDAHYQPELEALGIKVQIDNILMETDKQKREVMSSIVNSCKAKGFSQLKGSSISSLTSSLSTSSNPLVGNSDVQDVDSLRERDATSQNLSRDKLGLKRAC